MEAMLVHDEPRKNERVVVYEGMIREKPSSKEEARQYMRDYSGSKAATVSSVLVTNLRTGFRKGQWDKVEILFDEIPDETIDKLVSISLFFLIAGRNCMMMILQSNDLLNIFFPFFQIEEGAVLNVAGGLIIEHPLILPLVKEVVGTTDSVMGLPKAVTERLIMEAL
ncbi:hypothetical protein Cgig2_015645 [Carnegiea gigantea]|uniref:Maf-like protein DDB_G0281937 n=1 Tax=Carnegiea gigantea TaxID=171969 RepID=A0A9Q1K2K5_9CARY|nr:hypothetical protein Cgig2_015645 [Carnegiea gigantea]